MKVEIKLKIEQKEEKYYILFKTYLDQEAKHHEKIELYLKDENNAVQNSIFTISYENFYKIFLLDEKSELMKQINDILSRNCNEDIKVTFDVNYEELIIHDDNLNDKEKQKLQRIIEQLKSIFNELIEKFNNISFSNWKV